MSACGRHARLGSVTFNLITHSRSLARLWIDHLHIRNVDPGFLVDNSTAAIAGRFLVSFDYAGAFDLHFSTSRSDPQHASTLALVAAPSGVASFTVTLMRSPRLAIAPVEPPIPIIISTRRAPELSATSREVCI